MITDAIFSACGNYRHRLDFKVQETGCVALLCGVNPSVAGKLLPDGSRVTDHTVAKWHGFGERNEWARGIVVNALDRIATQVRVLAALGDAAVSADNLDYVDAAIAQADILVPCWGDRAKLPKQLRFHLDRMLARMRASGKPIKTFGFTKGGDPKHPLMLGYETPIVNWEKDHG